MIRSIKQVSGSFRDPSGRVYITPDKVFRGIDRNSIENYRVLQEKQFYLNFRDKGNIVRTQECIDDGAEVSFIKSCGWDAVLEHERLHITTYPYEWTFSMLRDAALLQLNLLKSAFNDGFTLKDSSPYNILFQGTRPVFIDIPSFSPRHVGDQWVAYRQFCMLYLYPLMIKSHLGLEFQAILRSKLDGITPIEASKLFYGLKRFRRGVLSHVVFPSKLENYVLKKERDNVPSRKRNSIHQSNKMVLGLIESMERLVRGLKTPIHHTAWSCYAENNSYETPDQQAKKEFVENSIKGKGHRTIWDIGCNTGDFSLICQTHSDHVLAIDGDHDSVESLYLKLGCQNEITPVHMDLSNTSPSQGWAGGERLAFDDRNKPDCILCLALVHHMRIGSNIPLDMFFEWLSKFGCDVVIEFVGREDNMVEKLLMNKEESYDDYNIENFEKCLLKYFHVENRLDIKEGHRTLYSCRALLG